jgi:hypothetical protein
MEAYQVVLPIVYGVQRDRQKAMLLFANRCIEQTPKHALAVKGPVLGKS